MKLPVLYKKTNTGAIQFWEISTRDVPATSDEGIPLALPDFGEITTTYGQLGTDSPQTTVDVIKKGKNAGRANATTASQQAEAEATAKWEKQKKKGYVESIEAAEAGEVDALIEGGVNPMLAQSFSKHAAKIKFPCFAQPKLDGHRCVAIVKGGKATLWSRTRKPITSAPHIVAELESMFADTDIILDGELYNHEYRAKFEELTSLIRQEEPAEGHENIQYHIYDKISDGDFETRFTELETKFQESVPGATDMDDNLLPYFKYCQLVHTVGCMSDEHISDLFAQITGYGYEGVMLRNGDGKYVGKRSYDLQKVKEFEDAEFDVVGIEEGRGKLIGHVGSFVCVTADGKEFLAKMSGSLDNLKRLFDDESLWRGKKLTVQYQGLTGANGVPRFPVGLRLREDV